MADILDIIGKLKPDDLPEDINNEKEINDFFKEKLGDNFDKFFGGKLEIMSDGIYATGGENPRLVDLEEYKKYSSVDQKDPYNSTGRTEARFKALGFTDSEIKESKGVLDNFFIQQDSAMIETEPAKGLQNAYDAGKESGKKSVPKSDADITQASKDQIKDVVKETLKQKDANESAGKWVKSGIKYGAMLALLSAGVVGLYEAVKHHQDAMNGCWIMNMTTGDKCKVTELTCNQGAKNNIPNGANTCGLCVDIGTGTDCGPLSFDPCPIGGTPINPSPAFFPDSGKNCSKTISDYTCKDSDNQVCKNCDSTIYNLIGNSKMICVNVDWWGALEDLIGGPLDTAISSTITMILNILKWTAVGIVILLVLYIIYRLTKYETSKSSESSESTESH